MMQEEQALLTTITILTPGKMLSPALSDPDEGCSKRVIYFTALSRSALCEGSGGCWETSGDHTGCAKEDVCPASSTRSTVLCSSPGPPDRAENSQPLPCRDAHILESEWPQIYSAALWDLGRAVSCREWKEWKTLRGMAMWTFQLADQATLNIYTGWCDDLELNPCTGNLPPVSPDLGGMTCFYATQHHHVCLLCQCWYLSHFWDVKKNP